MVVAARVVLRRDVDSVPIVGPEGEASVIFDADGSVVEIGFPMNAYRRAAQR